MGKQYQYVHVKMRGKNAKSPNKAKNATTRRPARPNNKPRRLSRRKKG